MKYQTIITVLCFGISVLCALVMLPLSAQLLSTSHVETLDGQELWVGILGVVGLISALTGKRLSERNLEP